MRGWPTTFGLMLLTAGWAPHDARGQSAERRGEYVLAAYGCFIWKEDDSIYAFRKPWLNSCDVRVDFPSRQPLAGWYDDTQERFDAHLRAMDAAGLDVLVFDWYPTHVTDDEDERVNECFDFFQRSRVDTRVRFCVSLINHDHFAMTTDAQWQVAVDAWAAAFRHPRYWRVDGRPVLTIHSNAHWERQEGGAAGVARRVAWLRERVRQAGCGELLLGAGHPRAFPGLGEQLRAQGFDFTTFYNLPNWEPLHGQLSKEKDSVLPYQSLIDAHRAVWAEFGALGAVPFAPYLTIQWDPRPWWGASPAHSLRYETPSEAELRAFFEHARDVLDSSPDFRLPTRDGAGVKAVFVCAWNELAEGSILAPTVGEGDRAMRAARAALSAAP